MPANVSAAAAVLAGGQSISDFYAARDQQLLWLRPGDEQAASEIVAMMEGSRTDGLDPGRYRVKELKRALRAAWGGSPAAVQRADRLISQSFVDYVRDLKRSPDLGVIYVDPQLRPQALGARAILAGAAAQPDLTLYVQIMGWMHPYYAQLRQALTQSAGYGPEERELIALNLERARALPGAETGKYVLVNAAQQRLFMMEGGQVVDMMRVVVGKPVQPTPMMAALIRYTSLNPYWNVPPDLVSERIAPHVVSSGIGYLKSHGYQVLSDWTDKATVVDPREVDWKAVIAGKEIRVRQLPGPANGMGAMKFMFPNQQGIYLHDTPSTELFSEASRLFSGGCVRLEAAPRLAAWLYDGEAPKADGAKPEQKVMLERPVPVYLTYLTAVPSGSEVAFYQDIYGLDASRQAQLEEAQSLASR